MKTVILAGGLGTRLQSPTEVRPKPMIEIGGNPLLWHIMGIYSACGFDEFVVALGYKASFIKDYFLQFKELSSDERPPWQVQLIDTGLHTQTGGRLRRLRPHLDGETFMLTYGDGLADIDVEALVDFHKSHGRLATVTAVRPPSRFGALNLAEGEDIVRRFDEKPQTEAGWINGGFFVLEPGVFDYLTDADDLVWERSPLEKLAADGQLVAYRHEGFWACMDTLKDKQMFDKMQARGETPWQVWRLPTDTGDQG